MVSSGTSAETSASAGSASDSGPESVPFEPSSGTSMGVRSPSAGPDTSETEKEEKEEKEGKEEKEEKKAGYGNLILARSKDLLHWEYIGHLIDEDTEGQIPLEKDYYVLDGAYECPDYIVLNGQEIVLTSPQNLPQIGTSYQNVHSGVYMLGALNFETGRFRIDYIGELDNGFDFYAAQTLKMPDGRVILIAWKEMWDRKKAGQAPIHFPASYTLRTGTSFKNLCGRSKDTAAAKPLLISLKSQMTASPLNM